MLAIAVVAAVSLPAARKRNNPRAGQEMAIPLRRSKSAAPSSSHGFVSGRPIQVPTRFKMLLLFQLTVLRPDPAPDPHPQPKRTEEPYPAVTRKQFMLAWIRPEDRTKSTVNRKWIKKS
ncbi:hypothetical protein ACRYCC_40435 [Actinomadura scrupuli]|uniref:hypothetical protein n=1 Tax=Actinomadura scrupuli TaxID=559629 RepID=UPI003D98B812